MHLGKLSLLQLSLLWTLALVISPLLFLQGMVVRRTAKRLPEGQPPAEGSFGDGEALKLVGLGDSVIAGVGVADMQDSLTAQLAAHIASRLKLKVDWKAEGNNGENSTGLLARLKSSGIPGADVYVVSIGVNDVTSLAGLVRWQFNVTELLALLRERKPRQVVMLAVPPMQRFWALPQPLRWALGVRAAMLNHTLRQAAILLDDVSLLDLSFKMDADHLAEDGYHPGPLACREMAEALAERLASDLKDPALETTEQQG